MTRNSMATLMRITAAIGGWRVGSGDVERLTAEVMLIMPIVERITGLSSRWSGALTIADTVEFYGIKEWSCTVSAQA